MARGNLILFWLLMVRALAYSQDTAKISFTAYGEIYYLHDFTNGREHVRPSFVYSHNRTGEVNVNLALLKASYETQRSRANFGLMTGTYSNTNMAAEVGVLKNVYEANAGVKVSKNYNLWIDAGVLQSHIGYESAVGIDNWMLTRSIAADNSPYFETGFRVSFSTQDHQKWYAAVLYLNGWQRIQRMVGNHTPSMGTQVTFKSTDKFLVNHSSFIGSDQPDSIRKLRYFQNVYSTFQVSSSIGVTIGLDVG